MIMLITLTASWFDVTFLLSVPRFTLGHPAESFQGSEIGADDVSLWPGETEADEGLEVSQEMMESLLLGAGTQLENEEYLMGISKRLQTALEKMLVALSDTTSQVQISGTNAPFSTCMKRNCTQHTQNKQTSISCFYDVYGCFSDGDILKNSHSAPALVLDPAAS